MCGTGQRNDECKKPSESALIIIQAKSQLDLQKALLNSTLILKSPFLNQMRLLHFINEKHQANKLLKPWIQPSPSKSTSTIKRQKLVNQLPFAASRPMQTTRRQNTNLSFRTLKLPQRDYKTNKPQKFPQSIHNAHQMLALKTHLLLSRNQAAHRCRWLRLLTADKRDTWSRCFSNDPNERQICQSFLDP